MWPCFLAIQIHLSRRNLFVVDSLGLSRSRPPSDSAPEDARREETDPDRVHDEPREESGQAHECEGVRHPISEQSPQRAVSAESAIEIPGQLEDALYVIRDRRTLACQPPTVSAAVDEHRSERVLELSQPLVDRGLGDMLVGRV